MTAGGASEASSGGRAGPVALRLSAVSTLLAAVLSACSNGANCPTLSACDIREQACQRAVMAAVSCMRGGQAKLPPVKVVSEDALLAKLQANNAFDEDTRAAYARWSRGLALFRLAPPDYQIDQSLADSVADIAAVYLNQEKRILVVDHGERLDDETAVETLAHEIVHALQDADYGLERFQQKWGTSYDASLAVDSVIEGEAVLYQALVDIQLAGLSPDDVDWEAYFAQWRSDTLDEAEKDAAPVARGDERFPYAFGGGFVTQYWLARGRAGVDALFDKPPLTTREIMFGPAPDAAKKHAALHERAEPSLPGGFEDVAATALGAWIGRIYAARMNVSVGARLGTASALAADVFSVQVDPSSDTVVAAWRASIVDGISPAVWPGRDRDAIEAAFDPGLGEAYLVASEAALPVPLGELAWRATDDEMTSAAGASAIVSPPPVMLVRHALGCHVRLPPLLMSHGR